MTTGDDVRDTYDRARAADAGLDLDAVDALLTRARREIDNGLLPSCQLAIARDNPYIEPAHLLAAMLDQPDGPKALLDRAGANTAALKTAMDIAVQGAGAGSGDESTVETTTTVQIARP